MNNIQIQGVDSTLSQVVLEDIQCLKRHLDGILVSSDQTLIINLIEETEFLLEQVKNDSRTYQEKYEDFNQLTQSWFAVWQRYKTTPEAIDLIRLINHLTDYSTAYSYLFRSLSLINEGRENDEADLERVVLGFSLLAEVVDVFVSFFSRAELSQIYDGARNAISICTRSITEYFESGLEVSRLVTQLRAYSSLIILKIEEHIKYTETTESEVTQLEDQTEIGSSSEPWWEKISGTFADNPVYDEAMLLGRKYRRSLR